MFNIPNILSICRLILIPIFTYEFVVNDNFVIAGILLAISGLTDCLDGFIARKFNMITNVGKILDPVADKLTQIMAVLCLALKGYKAMWILFGVLVIRDAILLVGTVNLYKNKDIVVSSNVYGKISTIIFYVAIIFVTFFYQNITELAKDIIVGLIIIAGIIALLRYTMYFFSIRTKKL